MINILPLNDLKEHEESTTCGCETTYLKKANKVIKKFNPSMGVCTGKTESGLKEILKTL